MEGLITYKDTTAVREWLFDTDPALRMYGAEAVVQHMSEESDLEPLISACDSIIASSARTWSQRVADTLHCWMDRGLRTDDRYLGRCVPLELQELLQQCTNKTKETTNERKWEQQLLVAQEALGNYLSSQAIFDDAPPVLVLMERTESGMNVNVQFGSDLDTNTLTYRNCSGNVPTMTPGI